MVGSFSNKWQERGSLSRQGAVGWQFFSQQKAVGWQYHEIKRMVAVFHDEKQEGGSYFMTKSSRVAIFYDKKQEGGSS